MRRSRAMHDARCAGFNNNSAWPRKSLTEAQMRRSRAMHDARASAARSNNDGRVSQIGDAPSDFIKFSAIFRPRSTGSTAEQEHEIGYNASYSLTAAVKAPLAAQQCHIQTPRVPAIYLLQLLVEPRLFKVAS
eukprot:19882-Heterococcus_DN1.PRE.5